MYHSGEDFDMGKAVPVWAPEVYGNFLDNKTKNFHTPFNQIPQILTFYHMLSYYFPRYIYIEYIFF